MNNRDRFRHVLRFERVDRLPRFEWATRWDQTMHRGALRRAQAAP